MVNKIAALLQALVRALACVAYVGWLLKNKKCISAKNKTLSGWLVRSAFLSCQYFVFLSFHNGLLFNIQSVVSVFYTWW